MCELNGTVDCSACSAGYRLNAVAGAGSQTCLPNTCTCPNGIATVASGSGGTLCEAHGSVDCSSCTSMGYLLNASAGPGQQMCQGTSICFAPVHGACDCQIHFYRALMFFAVVACPTGSSGVAPNCANCSLPGYYGSSNWTIGALSFVTRVVYMLLKYILSYGVSSHI